MRTPKGIAFVTVSACLMAFNIPVLAMQPALALTGVVCTAKSSLAIIRGEHGHEDVFQPGDRITRNAVLTRVYPTYVVVRVDSHFEHIYLNGDVVRRSLAPVPAILPYTDAFDVPIPGVKHIDDHNFVISRQRLLHFMFSTDAVTDARWAWLPTGGVLMVGMKDGSVYEKAGLRVGDTILQINATVLTKPSDLVTAYEKYAHEGTITLTLSRMNSVTQLHYQISAFNPSS